jgi:hypothetical protein
MEEFTDEELIIECEKRGYYIDTCETCGNRKMAQNIKFTYEGKEYNGCIECTLECVCGEILNYQWYYQEHERCLSHCDKCFAWRFLKRNEKYKIFVCEPCMNDLNPLNHEPNCDLSNFNKVQTIKYYNNDKGIFWNTCKKCKKECTIINYY